MLLPHRRITNKSCPFIFLLVYFSVHVFAHPKANALFTSPRSSFLTSPVIGYTSFAKLRPQLSAFCEKLPELRPQTCSEDDTLLRPIWGQLPTYMMAEPFIQWREITYEKINLPCSKIAKYNRKLCKKIANNKPHTRQFLRKLCFSVISSSRS